VKKSFFILLLVVMFSCGCGLPMEVDTVTFDPPSAISNRQVIDGLEIAVKPIDQLEESEEIFSTDVKDANILPIQLITYNGGVKEFEINHTQIFGITEDGRMTVAYTLNRAAQHVRKSSIGTTAVAGAVTGAVLGAAVGAGIGAGVDGSSGAESGAIIGGSVGAASGLGSGLSDSFTLAFKKQLAILAFEDRVVFPGDIQQGFVYLKWQKYNSVRVKVFDITDNKYHELYFPIYVSR
jgi:hypothetical protein